MSIVNLRQQMSMHKQTVPMSCAHAVRTWTLDADPLTLKPLFRRYRTMNKIKSFFNDESGMETLEYAMIAGLIAAVALLVYGGGWGGVLQTRLTNATTATP